MSSFELALTGTTDALVAAIIEVVRDNTPDALTDALTDEILTDEMLIEKTKLLIATFMDVSIHGWAFGGDEEGDEETKILNEYIAFHANGKPIGDTLIASEEAQDDVADHIDEALYDIYHAYMGENALELEGKDEALRYIVAAYNVYIDNKTSLTKAAR